jgi:RNA polymerase sigma-70 factor (ECF subfamily)
VRARTGEVTAGAHEAAAAVVAAWPEIELSDADFTAGVARAAAAADAGELYLACACAAGNAAAIRAFEARYFTCIASVVRWLRLPDDDAHEVAQTLRQRLFVGGVAEAGVLAYAGGGRLAGLMQVAATRIALNLRRGRHRVADEPAPDMPSVAIDTVYAKAEYRERVKQAIEDAAAALAPRDRTLLRLHLVERSSIDDIAALYRVHRATAARWVQAARETLVAHTRTNFLSATKLDAHDEAGLASFVESQLTLSLSRILS